MTIWRKVLPTPYIIMVPGNYLKDGEIEKYRREFSDLEIY